MQPVNRIEAWLRGGPADGSVRSVECGPDGPPELLMLRFGGGFPPVRLVGPAVFVHAVLLAYAQCGPGRGFLRAPYLLPLQHGASPLPVPVA